VLSIKESRRLDYNITLSPTHTHTYANTHKAAAVEDKEGSNGRREEGVTLAACWDPSAVRPCPSRLTPWMLLTQADIAVHRGISGPSSSRAQMAHSKGEQNTFMVAAF